MSMRKLQASGNPFTYIRKLVQAGTRENVKLELGASSGKITIFDRNLVISFTDQWKNATFQLKTKTEKELERHEIPPEPEKIGYVGVQPPGQALEIFEDVISIDVNAAYHQAALNLGYFSPELFERHLNAGKKERLQAFGATAKASEIFYLENGQLEHKETEKSDLRPFFLNSALFISDIFEEFKREFADAYIFHWVDCIFIKNRKGLKQRAEQFFHERGLEFHHEKTKFIIFESRKTNYYLQRGTEKGIKEYHFPRYDTLKESRAALLETLKRKEK